MTSTLDCPRSLSELIDQNSTISAVHKLPHELITDVFLRAEPMLGSGESDTRFLKTITSVCSAWRDAALSTPMLWSSIIVPSAVTVSVSDTLYHRVAAYLLRSRDASIDVSLTLYSYSKEEIGRIMELICPHMTRCHQLVLKAPDSHSLSAYLPFSNRLERLERLEVWLGWQNPGPIYVLGELANPPLQEMRFRGAIGQLLKNVPPSSLCRVHIDTLGAYWADTVAFVSQCVAAQYLWLEIDAEERLSTLSTFLLPELRSLTINDDLALGFTRYMLTPNLEDLTLMGGEWRGRFIDMASTRFPFLRTFALESFHSDELFTAATFGNFAMRHPDITKLSLSFCRSYSDLIAMLLDPGTEFPTEEHPLLPSLDVLHFRSTWSRLERDMYADISKLLEKRPTLHVGCDRYTMGDSGDIEALVRKYGGRFTKLQ